MNEDMLSPQILHKVRDLAFQKLIIEDGENFNDEDVFNPNNWYPQKGMGGADDFWELSLCRPWENGLNDCLYISFRLSPSGDVIDFHANAGIED